MLAFKGFKEASGRSEIRDCLQQLVLCFRGIGGVNVLPAETEIPAPATTTILRFLYSTFSSLSNCSCCASAGSSEDRCRVAVVRSLGSLSFRRLLGRGLSSRCGVDAGVELSIPSGLGVLPSDDNCDDCGDG
jgi:hypothetical protein